MKNARRDVATSRRDKNISFFSTIHLKYTANVPKTQYLSPKIKPLAGGLGLDKDIKDRGMSGEVIRCI